MANDEFVQVLTTLEREQDAARLAGTVLEARTAACVQIVGPITSHYWWQGEVRSAAEWLCIAKTTAAALDRIIDVIARHHPYETPEITATPITGGSRDYLAWIATEVGGG